VNEQLWFLAAIAVFSLWAAVFATRADLAARGAKRLGDQRWADSVRPLPRFNFTTSAPPVGQPLEVEIQNLGGALAAGAVIVQHGDDLFAAELTMPEKSEPRRILLAPVMKAWQKANQPRCLLLLSRDVSGICWDGLDGNKVVKDPRKWLASRLRELRLLGVVDFPALTGPTKA
jgi:hypothetical protein